MLKQEIASYREGAYVESVGRVLEVGDGIARIWGLHDAMAGEVLMLADNVAAQVFNLEEDSIGAVIYGPCESVREGDPARTTGKLLHVPVGEAMLGRVIGALGEPIDGAGEIPGELMRPVEFMAPGIAARQPVNAPLHTGVKAVDSMIPIGRGQRELIIGDRKTGKTAIAIDAIINQSADDVLCVYVAIGQKESAVAGIVETLASHGAMDYTVVVSAGSADPAPLQYLAPYVGCAIAEHFMYSAGRDTLVVYDDLTKHAVAYRQLSLLLRRAPGREAYPGDIFYLHSRLLERSCKLAEEYEIVPADLADDAPERQAVNGAVYLRSEGQAAAAEALAKMDSADKLKVRRVPGSGGSLTALPIAETLEGEIAAYIPTNLISITDGQIYLEPSLFQAGIRPAINVGVSVSRVGAAAQTKAMKRVAKTLRLQLAAYRELEAFVLLGTELGATAGKQLQRGARMVELLKQVPGRPMNVADQVIGIFAASGGYMDDIYLSDIREFEKELLAHMKTANGELYEAIDASADLTDEDCARLGKTIEGFRDRFNARHRHGEERGESGGE